jgi:hypothetical protein
MHAIVTRVEPLLAEDVAKASYSRAVFVEDKFLPLLVGNANDAIAKARDKGQTRAEMALPCFVSGFPLLDVAYLERSLTETFQGAGFTVTHRPPRTLVLSWAKPSAKPAKAPQPPLVQQKAATPGPPKTTRASR